MGGIGAIPIVLPKHYFLPVTIIVGIFVLFPHLLYSRILDGVSFYIKPELGFESNIFEDSTNTRGLQDQLWFGLTHDHQTARQQLHLKITTNLALYNDYHDENKALNMLILNHNYSLGKSLSAVSNIEVFNKQWYQSSRGYTSSLANTALCYSRVGFQTLAGVEYKFNNFPTLLLFNSDNTSIFLQVFNTPSRNRFLSAKIAWHSIRYSDRSIYVIDHGDSTNLTFQKDRIFYIQLGSEIRKKNVSGIYFRFLNNTSNSEYSAFQSASMRLFTSRKVLGFYTQMIVELQLKKYSGESHQPLVIINADPEQNIQNQIMFGWDKPLSPNLALQGKIAYFKNETIYSNQYYDKWFTSIGVMYRF